MKQLLLSLLLCFTPVQVHAIALSQAQLTERSGVQMNFSREAIGDHVVVIGFTWGGCQTVCPITDRIMAETHEKMGDRLGSVRLVTVTLDPFGDTPKALAARARELGASKDWLWLGGDFRAVDQVLAGLGARPNVLIEHAPMFLVGDGRTRTFIRKQGLPGSDELVVEVDKMLAARAR